jgi:hypothetical protein
MAIEKSVPENGDEVSSTYRSRFKLACWMIEHMDRRRASIRGRTTVLLTANAALLAGVTFLLARALSKEAVQLPDLLAIGASAVLLVVSMLLAVNSIISLWINPFRNE